MPYGKIQFLAITPQRFIRFAQNFVQKCQIQPQDTQLCNIKKFKFSKFKMVDSFAPKC